MKTSGRILLLALLIGLLTLGAITWNHRMMSQPIVVSWSAVGLPGSAERIASFPELVELSQNDLQPVTELQPLPFTLDTSEKPAVSLTVERQTLLGVDAFAPRPSARIVADLAGKQSLTIAERDALTGAYLDLGQSAEAVAVHRRFQDTAADQSEAHWALINLLDAQNVIPEALNETQIYFDRLLAKAQAEHDQKQQDLLLEEIKSLLHRQETLRRRTGSPTLDEGEMQRKMIDAFPERTALLVDYADHLMSENRHDELAALLEPRMARYRTNRVDLWRLQGQIHRLKGSLDQVIHALEEELRTDSDQDRYLLYAEYLQEAGLLDERRAALLSAMKAEPSVSTLQPLIHLEIASGHQQEARDLLTKQIPVLSAGADVATLLKLAELADVLGEHSAEAEALTLDAALLGGEENPELYLKAAERLQWVSQDANWPFGGSAAGAFNPAFMDTFPSIHGGLLSLGTNRMGARGAMQNMPSVGARHASRQQAILLALRAANLTKDPLLIFRATELAVQLFQKAQLPERMEQYAGITLSRLGEKQENSPRVMLWYADAAALRKNVDEQIAALNRALTLAQEMSNGVLAGEIQLRLETLLIDNQRYSEVLAVKWERVERFPTDEAAMNDLMNFAEQYELFDDVERAYRMALERFDRPSWSDKFARWLLRHKRQADFEALIEKTAETLGEGELAKFLSDHVQFADRQNGQSLFFEKIYAIALQRFPANLEMNRRLLNYYHDRGWHSKTANLDYQNRYLDQALRIFSLDREITSQLLLHLSERNMLKGMLVKLEASQTLQPAEMYLWASIQRFLARYELALLGYRELDSWWPCRDDATASYATLARSLADSYHVRDPQLYASAAAAHGRLAARRPLDIEQRTLQGETLVQAGRPQEASAAWEMLVTAAPGEPERWLELATLYWDYYLADQAKQTLIDGRLATGQADMHAKEMGYLLEDEGQLEAALDEYVKVVLTGACDTEYYDISRRLQYVVRAGKTSQEKVDGAFWRRLQRPARQSSEGQAFVDWLRAHGRVDEAKAAAYKLLPLYEDTTFAEGAYQMFVSYNDEQGAEACLNRLLEVSKREPGMLRRATAFYENRKDLVKADALVEEILDSAKTPSTKEEARQFAADYYWRSDRREQSLDFYRRLAEETTDKYQVVGRWVYYAERCLEFEAPDRALEALEKLRAERRTDPALVSAMARAYAVKGEKQGLIDFYKVVLNDLQQAPLNREDRNNLEVRFRYALVAALTELDQTREGVEQYIKIINLTTGQGMPEKTVVLAAYNYAKRCDQVTPLLAYYEHEAERANRDFRWQVVAALIYEAQGRYPDAAAMLDKAIANEPQRIELLEWQAEALIKGGDYDGAVQVYKILTSRRLTGGDYQMRIVEVLYIAGRPEEAEKRLAEILAAQQTDYRRVIEAALLAWRFGRRDAQLAYAERAINMILESPDTRRIDLGIEQIWLLGQLESKGAVQAIEGLRQTRQQLTQAAAASHPIGRKKIMESLDQIDGLINRCLAEWLGTKAGGDERAAAAEAYEALLREWLQQTNDEGISIHSYTEAIQAATVAQMPTLARTLQREDLARWVNTNDDSRANQAAARLYDMIGTRSPADLADEVKLLVEKNILSSPYHEQFNLLQADLARALGEENQEKTALAEYLANTQYPEAGYIRRYFSLLNEEELEEYLTGDCAFSWALVIWLAERGETEKVVRLLEKHHAGDKTWLLAKKALIYQHDPAFADEAVAAYRELLGLPLSIARLAGKERPEEMAADKVWTHYGLRYAAFQAGRKDPEAALYIYANAERYPISQDAYLTTTTALDKVERFDMADAFLEKAAIFGEGDDLTIARARHLAKRGRAGDAADELGKMIAEDEVTLYRMEQYADLMAEIGRGKDALSPWRDLLFEKLPKLNEYERRDLLAPLLAYAEKIREEKRAGELAREFLATDYYRPDDIWIMNEDGTVPDNIVGWAWQLALDRLALDSNATEYFRSSISEKALVYGLTAHDEKLCRSALTLIEKADPNFYNYMTMRLQRLQVSYLFDGLEATEEAAMEFVQHDLSSEAAEQIVKWLQVENQPEVADRVWLAYIEPRLNDATSRLPWESDNITEEQRLQTLGAYLRLGIAEPTPGLIAELEEAAGEDTDRISALQNTLMENGAAAEALRLADKAAALAPMSAEIYRRRIANYLQAEQADRAAELMADGWKAGHDGREEVTALVIDLAVRAARLDSDAWEEAAEKLPTPLRELTLGYLYIVRGKGQRAAAVLGELTEPYRYPLTVHFMRTWAYRLEGDAPRERAALLDYLRYVQEDRRAGIRLAQLDLKNRPYAGLWQLGHQEMRWRAWEKIDPLSAPSLGEMEYLFEWWEMVGRENRNDLALEVLAALEEIDWPAAAVSFGTATVQALGDQAEESLRKRVAALTKDLGKRRRAQPVYFIPDTNLLQ